MGQNKGHCHWYKNLRGNYGTLVSSLSRCSLWTILCVLSLGYLASNAKEDDQIPLLWLKVEAMQWYLLAPRGGQSTLLAPRGEQGTLYPLVPGNSGVKVRKKREKQCSRRRSWTATLASDSQASYQLSFASLIRSRKDNVQGIDLQQHIKILNGFEAWHACCLICVWIFNSLHICSTRMSVGPRSYRWVGPQWISCMLPALNVDPTTPGP